MSRRKSMNIADQRLQQSIQGQHQQIRQQQTNKSQPMPVDPYMLARIHDCAIDDQVIDSWYVDQYFDAIDGIKRLDAELVIYPTVKQTVLGSSLNRSQFLSNAGAIEVDPRFLRTKTLRESRKNGITMYLYMYMIWRNGLSVSGSDYYLPEKSIIVAARLFVPYEFYNRNLPHEEQARISEQMKNMLLLNDEWSMFPIIGLISEGITTWYDYCQYSGEFSRSVNSKLTRGKV